MIQISLTIPGLKRFQHGLELAPDVMHVAQLEAMKMSQFALEAEAKRLTPVVTSRLRGSITPGAVTQFGGDIEGVVGTNVIYAPMIEFGAPAGFPINYANGRATKYGRTRPYVAHLRQERPGRHYMRDGLKAATPTILGLFQRAVEKVLKSIKEGA